MYQLVADVVTGATTDRAVLRVEDGAVVPADPSNVDWIAYQAWVAAGNTPSPAPQSSRTIASASVAASSASASAAVTH